jgi:hypothetical protein
VLALDALFLGLLLLVLCLAGFALRRQLLRRSGGTVDVSLRLRDRRRGYGWALGVVRYDGDSLLWYRLLSLAPRPRRAVPRHGLVMVGRRQPTGTEALNLMSGAVVVECRAGDGRVELAMSEAAYPGFLSWLEATPSVGSDIV